MIIDFAEFSSIPIALQNNVKISLKVVESFRDPFRKIRISSTKRRREIIILSLILTPRSEPFFLAVEMSLLRPSITRRNKRGERGQL